MPEEINRPRSERDIAKQWTPKLKDAGFTAIADVFLLYYREELGITNVEAMLIIQLMYHKWNADPPYPSFTNLSIRMGLTEQQVRFHALNLVKKGYLRKTVRQGRSNLFHLEPLLEKLETVYDDLARKHPQKKVVRKAKKPTQQAEQEITQAA